MGRVLISVYDKTGITEMAGFLKEKGWEIVSTGGTRRSLTKAGIDSIDITDVTGFPEMMDGRVKTLHPAVHAGLLARRNRPDDMETLNAQGLSTLDMVIVNLYPFLEKAEEGLSDAALVEFIDIGGPSMLRSAAKNFQDVLVISSPADYPEIKKALNNGEVPVDLRRKLAAKAFSLTGAYDAAIAGFLNGGDDFPEWLNASYRKKSELRYGENSHQKAAFYTAANRRGAMSDFNQLGGKELSFNNIRDMDTAWKAVSEFAECACCGLKHSTPCALAVADTPAGAWERAYECDPVSIFGGIAAFNRTVDQAAAEQLVQIFLEIVIAPDFSADALEIFRTKKKNLRVIQALRQPSDTAEIIPVDGGLLVQQTDRTDSESWEVVTETAPTEQEKADLLLAWKVVKHVKSNAIVAAADGAAAGIGGGQVNRIWAATQALERGAGATVLASDAFFPFSDVVKLCAEKGIRAIIQPGGSVRDADSIKECNNAGIAMVFTGVRHFKH